MIPPQHHILDLPPIIVDSLGFGVQILTRYLSTLSKENMANPQDNPPPMPILCRICERQIQPWWFEKHTELCLSEHKAESQVLLCQDNLRDQQRELMRLMEVFGFDASATTEYHGQTISPSPSPSAASTLMQSRGREISISPRSKKRPLHNGPTVRMLEMILDLCATALDISTPAIKDTDLEQPSEELRTQSPQSEARISQVLQWQSPNIENPVLAAVLSDTESYARHKVDSVLRLRNIIHYSERIRQELYVAVEETIVETIGKAQGIPNLDFHAGVDELISPFQAATLGPKYQRSPILSPRLLDESPPSGSPQEAATPRSISGRPAIYDRKYSGTVLDDDVQSDSSSIHQNELDKIESPQSDSETVPRFFTERKKSSLYGGSPRRVMSPTRNYSPSSLKAPRQRVPSIFNLSGQSTATLEAPSSAPTFPFDHTHHRRQSSVTSDISKLSQSPRTSKLTMINQKPNPPSIKDFEIIKPISKGAFGSVYLSKKKSTGDYYAIKVLKKADMVSKNQITNIKAERAILMAQGESPFVANLFFTFQSKDYLYLVMEYLNGGDCAALLKALGRLDEVWAKRYLAEVVLGVQHLHERGIIHRDLKPDNLLIDSHGHLKLTDFGLSRMGLIGRQNRVRGSNASDTPDLLHQGPFARPPSFASSRSASFDFMASPVQTPYLIPDIQQHPNLSYFQSRNDNDGISRRTSGTRSDSGSESIYSALGSFSLNDANLIKRIDDDARSDSSNSSDVSAAAAHPLASLSQVTSSQQHMPPPALALFDPNDESRKFVGTPDYLAPETINGGGQDEMSDWWSIGCILFEFLLGYPPFHADTPERVFQNILNRRIDWPKEDDLISQEVSEDAKDLIGRLICLDPSTRLGANGAKEVKSHPYFRAVKWDALLNEEASFVPQLTHAESTDYFDDRGATLQTFTEEQVEENGSSLYASMLPGGTEVPSENLKKDASFPKRSNAIPLHIRPHVREKRTRRLSEPSGLDTFGSFTFKNLPVLEKANKEVIQRLRSEHSTVSRPRHTSLSGIGFRRPGSPASSSSSAQTSISPARSSQPSSPATVSAPFSASSTGSVGHTSFPKLQKSQSGTSCQSSFPFEVPHELGRTQSLSSGSQGGHLRLSSSSNFSPMRTELVALIGPGVEANPPSTAPKNKVSRSRANTAGSDDRCSVIEVLRRNKAQSQVFDISPSSSENEDGRVSVLARVQRRRQDSRRMSSRSFTTGPRFRRLDVLCMSAESLSNI